MVVEWSITDGNVVFSNGASVDQEAGDEDNEEEE
jgi:hypothetical protein